MKEFGSAVIRSKGRASAARFFAVAVAVIALATPKLLAQDGYAPNYPTPPNAPTAIRPRPTSGLTPAVDPVLQPVPQEPADAALSQPEFPGSNPATAPNPQPAPPLLPPPAWTNQQPIRSEAAPTSAPRNLIPDRRAVARTTYDSQSLPAARSAVAPASVTAPAVQPATPLKLPPPKRGKPDAAEASSEGRSTNWSGSIVTMVTSLAIVLGLFALAVWLMRRGMGAAGLSLPSEAVAVLGQLPLTGRQQILLVRIGPKLLLVSTNGETSSTLTEIEEPDEVDRIVGLCAESQPHSTTQTFRSLLAQMSTEPAAGGFLGESHRHTRDLASSGAPARDD